MKRSISLLIGLSLLIGYSGCNKEGVCVSTTGKTVTESREVSPFNCIDIFDNINLILTQDSTKYGIVVEAGENLIAGISTEIDNGMLILKNNNSCNWLRSFEVPVNVYLTYSYLDTIVFQASGNIECTNTWTADSIYVNIIEGAGDIDLDLHVARSTVHIRYGTVSVKMTGKSGVTFISSKGYGPVHAEDLSSKFTYIYTFSPNDVFVYAQEELGVEIANIGNVYYKGKPKVIESNIYGGGKLMEL